MRSNIEIKAMEIEDDMFGDSLVAKHASSTLIVRLKTLHVMFRSVIINTMQHYKFKAFRNQLHERKVNRRIWPFFKNKHERKHKRDFSSLHNGFSVSQC